MATLLDMRTASLQLANREVAAGVQDEDKFVTNVEVDRWVNMAIKELVSLLTRHGIHWTESLFEVDASSDLTDSTVYLPADLWSVLTVHGVDDDGTNWRLGRHDHRFRPNTEIGAPAVTYRVYKVTTASAVAASLGSFTRLELAPTPSAGTYEVRYVPVPPTLVDDDDEFDGVMGWEEYIHAWVARRILMKEGSSVSDMDTTLMDMRRRVASEAQAAELTEGLTVANVRCRQTRLPGDYPTSLRPRGWY